MIFKCKMCGGALEIDKKETISICEYCGTKQTLPKLDNDRRINLYDRANHFRRNNEFDKAMGIYEQILDEDYTDAEAYWSIILCRYGVEYVEDPVSHKRVPTVNRTQYTSIFDDDNYKSAIQYADSYQRSVYEAEATAINEIQKGILEISQNEKPFDIFICYKETDSQGERTVDSVLAQDLYSKLTQEGFKVFFARITLEDKLGFAYEPFIFAALNSSKVMVVLGTKAEFFNSVWVRNEWSRYLALIKQGHKKMLIPAYKDMDPYDLPDEFSHLQAQDMSKIGFMQDLVRGIKKIINVDEINTSAKKLHIQSGTNAGALLKRAFIFLEDADWKSADEYCEKVLDLDPENAMAYLAKLMIMLGVSKQENLVNLEAPFDNNAYYDKAFRYADDKLRKDLLEYITIINERNENKRLDTAYHEAKRMMQCAETQEDYLYVAEKFNNISEYLNASELESECYVFAEKVYNRNVYISGCDKEAQIAVNLSTRIHILEKAISEFEKIPHYKDSAEKISKLKWEVDDLKIKFEARKKRNKKIITIGSLAALFTGISVWLIVNVLIPSVKYASAEKCVANAEYLQAISIYEELTDYKDSPEKVKEARYLLGLSYIESKKYSEAIDIFADLGKYEASAEKLKESKYLQAVSYSKKKKYKEAHLLFSEISDFKDSAEKQQENGYKYARQLMKDEDYSNASEMFWKLEDYKDSEELKNECYLKAAEKYYDEGDFGKSIVWYEKIDSFDEEGDVYVKSCIKKADDMIANGDYRLALDYLDKIKNDSQAKEFMKEAKYQYVLEYKNNTNLTTYEYLKELKSAGYKDSVSIYNELYAWKVKVVVNDDEDDDTTDMISISKYNNWYFHVSLSGGEPDGEVQLKYTGYFPGGDTYSNKWDSKWSDGWSGTCWFWYNNPAYGKQGTFKLKVYDGSGNLIGEKSVKITG